MHVTLIVKPDAGNGDHSIDALVSRLEKSGHEVVALRRSGEWQQALEAGTDLVLIGGGDGTVGKVVRRLTTTDIPFAVLPLGTANNIAHQLGWLDKPSKIIKALEAARRVPFDVGLAKGPWGSWHFIESVGIGPFARNMALLSHTAGDVVKDPSAKTKALERDLKMLDAVLMESHAERCRIEVDGTIVDENVILAEVMNVGRIGPNVHLAAGADAGDGSFDLVVATEADRERLHEYIAARLDGGSPTLDLPTRPVKSVRFIVESSRIHMDDVLWPEAVKPLPAAGAPFTVDISVQPGMLTALMPDE
jgi:diacylglycerol kinase (ATP)